MNLLASCIDALCMCRSVPCLPQVFCRLSSFFSLRSPPPPPPPTATSHISPITPLSLHVCLSALVYLAPLPSVCYLLLSSIFPQSTSSHSPPSQPVTPPSSLLTASPTVGTPLPSSVALPSSQAAVQSSSSSSSLPPPSLPLWLREAAYSSTSVHSKSSPPQSWQRPPDFFSQRSQVSR